MRDVLLALDDAEEHGPVPSVDVNLALRDAGAAEELSLDRCASAASSAGSADARRALTQISPPTLVTALTLRSPLTTGKGTDSPASDARRCDTRARCLA
jgi:hypothetical protein